MMMQTWRWTELLQMLEVTTIDNHSHVGRQALGEVCHRLVDVFLWYPRRSVVLGFGWSLWYRMVQFCVTLER